MALNRRTFLKYGIAGAALMSVGGLGLGLRATVMRTPQQPLRVLSLRQYAILAAIAETLCPGDDDLPTAIDLQVPEKVDALLDSIHPVNAAEFIQLLQLMENALTGLAFDGRITPFSASTPEQRSKALNGWRTSRWQFRRMAFVAVSGLCMASYWSDPKTFAYVGYDGPPPLGAARGR